MEQKIGSQHSKKETMKQPIICPWVAAQPYPSPLASKNRNCSQKRKSNNQTNSCMNLKNGSNSSESATIHEKSTFVSMQQSSSQFFHFLRLMQLFPQTHPATLHTVLSLCKNDFFCAVDKLLYAKRCKMLYTNRRPQMQYSKNPLKCTLFNAGNRNHSLSNLVTQKRSFSKCQMNEDRENDNKLLKTTSSNSSDSPSKSGESGNIKLNNSSHLNADHVAAEPTGTIKYITIKTSNIQGTKADPSSENFIELKKVETSVD